MRWARLLVTLLFAAAAGCDSDSNSTTGPPPHPPPVTLPASMGADISALERIEDAGGVFRDAGIPGDAIAILKAHGANSFRLRLFVNPDGSEVQVNDLAYTLRMAQRIKATGATFLLDLHYSDTWADPADQTIPAAWAGLTLDSLEQVVESYSAEVMTRLRDAGTLPEIVQVGNEIDGGMLWPLGRVGGVYDTPGQWSQLSGLLQAGIRGIRSALGPADTVRIMLHYSQGASVSGTQWFVDHMKQAGVPFDVLGLSYYPWWHGPVADLRANLQAAVARYGIDVMLVEVSYPWRAGGWEGMVNLPGAMTWPISPTGQAQFLRDVTAAVAALPQKHGAGVYWWYPEAIPVNGLFVFGGGSLALFDDSGSVLPAASELGGGAS